MPTREQKFRSFQTPKQAFKRSKEATPHKE